MKKSSCILLLLTILAGCSEPPSKKEVKEKAPEKIFTPAPPPTVVPKQPLSKRLTDQNVKAMLIGYLEENPERLVTIGTRFGDITIRLYEETPLHRSNFVLLSKNYFDGSLFYRVAKDFVVQGGESDDPERRMVKKKLGKYTIPKEFNSALYHKKGAVAMTREYEDNPKKRSSSASFYIVVGKKYSKAELKYIASESGQKFSSNQIETYTTIGGNPSLDGIHTVFGEVVSGMAVVEQIAQQEVDSSERPNEDILIAVKEVK